MSPLFVVTNISTSLVFLGVSDASSPRAVNLDNTRYSPAKPIKTFEILEGSCIFSIYSILQPMSILTDQVNSLVEISRGVVHLGGPCFLAMTLFTAHRESFQPLEMPADPLYI